MLTPQDRKALQPFVFVLAALAVVWAASLMLDSGPSFEKCPAIEGQESGANTSHTNSKATVPTAQSPEANNGSGNTAKKAKECAEDPALAKYTWQLAHFTFGLLLATVALGALGAVQLNFLRKADRTGTLTAQAASNNAKAALNAGRAHIWMKNISFKFTRDPAGVIAGHEVAYEIWNGGPTPGIVKIVQIQLFTDPLGEWPAAPTYGEGGKMEHAGLVAPGTGHKRDGITFNFDVPVDEALLTAFKEKTKPVIFFGYVSYSDVFDPTVVHQGCYAYTLSFKEGDQSTACSFKGPDSYWAYS